MYKNINTAINRIREIFKNKVSLDYTEVEAATIILRAELGLSSYNDVKIVTLFKELGFQVIGSGFKDNNISGIMGIGEKVTERFQSNRVIILNKKKSPEHQRFTLAHELYHYIFDYKENGGEYSGTYRRNNTSNRNEQNASFFAACFLMPKDSFLNNYKQCIEMGDTRAFACARLSELYHCPVDAVDKRIDEVMYGK